MGTVYRAWDTRLDRPVALKKIHPERAENPTARQRFLREAQTAARLNHPALIHVHDIFTTENDDWIVMELIEGEPLDKMIKNGSLAVDQVLALSLDISGGLAAAHAGGVLHRDLKAENVVIATDEHTPFGRAKVLDFGLARSLETDDTSQATITGDGRILGTPRAISPEQANGEEIDARSDLFSLGVLLYEMLTGTSPFLGPGPAETLARICHYEQPPVIDHVPEIPPELSTLVNQLLAKNREGRPESASLVLRTLQRMVDSRRDDAGEPLPPENAGPSAPDAAILEKPFQPRGEHRQLTILGCELTGIALEDPEVLFEVLPAFQRAVQEAVERYEGHLYDVQGHRLVMTFGYPTTHEDNARRAILAGQQIAESVARLEEAPGAGARIGIHSGDTVILQRSNMPDHLTFGETLDIAITLQEEATPGEVAVSPTARALAESRTLKTDLPFVGRRQELNLLSDRMNLAFGGNGQVVLVTGEAGIGKSRLIYELQQKSDLSRIRWVSAQAEPENRHQVFAQVAALLRQLLEVDEDTTQKTQLEELAAVLAENDFAPDETLPIFATLLGLPVADEHKLDLSALRHNALEAIPALIAEMAERHPTVLAIEDLQWVDATTLELIGRIVEQTPSVPLLTLLAGRSVLRAPWRQLTRLQLSPLSAEESTELAEAAGVRDLAVDVVDGIPLFIEAMGRSLAAGEDLGVLQVPRALRDLMSVQLERSGNALDVALAAALLGREFSVWQLLAVTGLDQEELEGGLQTLLSRNVLETIEDGYRFRYELLRRAAQSSLLKEDLELLRPRLEAKAMDDEATILGSTTVYRRTITEKG